MQMDDALDIESVFDELAQSHRDTLTAMIFTWDLAVRLFYIGDSALLDRIPTQEEIKTHKKYLDNLIRLGEFFRPRIKDYGPDDLAKFGLERGMLLATIRELEDLSQEREELF
jgi:hypothetical protein